MLPFKAYTSLPKGIHVPPATRFWIVEDGEAQSAGADLSKEESQVESLVMEQPEQTEPTPPLRQPAPQMAEPQLHHTPFHKPQSPPHNIPFQSPTSQPPDSISTTNTLLTSPHESPFQLPPNQMQPGTIPSQGPASLTPTLCQASLPLTPVPEGSPLSSAALTQPPDTPSLLTADKVDKAKEKPSDLPL